MHRALYHLLLLSGLALCSWSCTEDSFSQIVDIPIPEHEPQPVLSLEFAAGDSVVIPLVSRSYGVLEEEPREDRPTSYRLLRDGELILEGNGNVQSADFYGVSDGQGGTFGYDTLAAPATPGLYRFEAAVDGIGSAFAEQRMPAAPTVLVRSYQPDGAVDIDGFRQDELILSIEDTPGEDNFYGFRVNRTSFDYRCQDDGTGMVTCDSFPRNQNVFASSPDPLFLESDDYGLVLRDDSFSGGSKDIRLQFYQQGEDPNLTVEVFSLTEDGYRYVTSRYAAEEAEFNPFAEPVTVHENIEGGVGIFMVSNLVLVKVE